MAKLYSFQVHLDPNTPLEKLFIDKIENLRKNKLSKKQILMNAIESLEESDIRELKKIIKDLNSIKESFENVNFTKNTEYTNDTYDIEIDDLEDAKL